MRRAIFLALLLGACSPGDGGGGGDPGFSPPPVPRRVAFRAEVFAARQIGLFVVDLSGANFGVIVPEGVLEFAWGPDGRLAWRTAEALFVDGVRVSRGPVERFAWSPDGRVAFLAGGILHLNGVDVSPSTVLEFAWVGERLAWRTADGELVVDGVLVAPDVVAFAGSPRTDFVAFIAETPPDRFELFTYRFDRREVIRISVDAGDVTRIAWSPDGSHLSWIEDARFENRFELFASPPDRPFIVLLSGDLIPTGDVVDFGWSPDSLRVAFIADASREDVFELFSTFRGGGIPVQLSGSMPIGGDVVRFAWSPDATRLLYLADQTADDLFELFVVAATSSLHFRVSGPMTFGGDVLDFGWSEDGSLAAYLADEVVEGRVDLFLAAPGRASGSLVAVDATAFAFAGPDLVYIAGGELFSNTLRLSPPLAPGGEVLDFSIR